MKNPAIFHVEPIKTVEMDGIAYPEWQWFAPSRNDTKLVCCDCKLTHKVRFRLVKCGRNRNQIEWQIRRDERATAARRRKRVRP